MSYEGSVQVLCKNGHYSVYDCYAWEFSANEEDRKWRCNVCGAKAAWTNGIDETNGQDPETGHGYGYIELEVATPEEKCICPTCKHEHICKQATYKIPKRKT